MTTTDPAVVARQLGKTANWVKRHAARYPHHRVGRTYVWTDEDIRDWLDAMRVRPQSAPASGGLRPIARGRRVSA